MLFLWPAAAHAQRWTAIGKTSSGNDVFVDSRSIKRTGALVAATVRLVLPALRGSLGDVALSWVCTH